MHVILEGIAPYEVSCILYEYVNNRKAVTIDQINSRLRWLFSCLILDKFLLQALGPVLSFKLSITRSESITTSNKAIILGQRYCKGNSVVIGITAGKLRFGIIEFILWKEKSAHLVVETVENIGFDSSLNAYRIVKQDLQFKTYEVFKCNELLDFHPLDTVSLPDSRLFIRAKYHLF